MFRLVVLSALVAVSLAAPSASHFAYSAPLLAPAIVSSIPTSISSHSNTVFHGAAPVFAAYKTAPVVAVEAAPVVAVKSIASVPTSVSSYSSSVVHDAKPVVSVEPVAETLEIVEPAVEVKSAPAVEIANTAADTVEVLAPAHASVVSVPQTISSHSSTVFHGSKAVVAAPIVASPIVEYRSAPAIQYAAYPAVHSYSPYIQAW